MCVQLRKIKCGLSREASLVPRSLGEVGAKKWGFTLIELLVVIVIIGILATLATVAMNSSRANARDAKRVSDLRQIANSVEMYYADHNSYPSYATAGIALKSADGVKTYMAKVPADPSTNTSYSYFGSGANFTIRATIEKGASEIPVGPIIITNKSGVKQAVNTDNRYLDSDLAFGSLVGHWALDGNNGTSDLSGYGNNINLIVGLATSTGRFNELNGSYDFLGDINFTYAAARIPASVIHDVGTDWTISIWFYNKINETSGSMQTILTRNSQSLPSYGHWWIYDSYDTPYRIRFQVYDTVLGNTTLTWDNSTTPNQWHHLVFRMNNDSTIELFVNGLSKGSRASATNYKAPLYNASIPSYLGDYAGNNNAAYRLGGKLADFRLYNSALTNTEIVQLYNATKP
jgi:general secretion pathway protein G